MGVVTVPEDREPIDLPIYGLVSIANGAVTKPLTGTVEKRAMISALADMFSRNIPVNLATLMERFPKADPNTLLPLTDDPEVKQALSLRGIVYGDILTPEVEAILLILTDTTSSKTLDQKLQLAGITGYQLQNLMMNNEFRKRFNNAVESMSTNSSIALMSLQQQVLKGNMKAIEMTLAMSGRYDPKRQAQLSLDGAMSEILDAIIQEVKDPEALTRISMRMQGISAKMGMESTRRTIEG